VSENCQAYITALFGFDAVVQRVEPHQWGQQSPCDRWDARGVLNHNIIMAHIVAEMTKGRSAAVPATGAKGEYAAPHGEGFVLASHLAAAPRIGEGDDPILVWNERRDLVQEALDAPGADATKARSPWGHSTVDEFLGFAFYDPLVHTWDLAKAVGQPVFLDPALVGRALSMLEDPGDERNLRQPISLAEPVATTAADPASRLIALVGRDPAS
jgi:uncharacterized protein (TIGR03086 family)